MILGYIPSVLALGSEETNAPKGYVTISVEKLTLGQGYIKEPVKVPFYEGDKVAHLITRLLGSGNYTNTGTVDDTSGSVETGFYLASVRDGFNGSEETNIPQYILDEAGDIEYERGETGFLGEFDYTSMSGWMYCVNNWFPNYGAGVYEPQDGDVIRWQFTVHGYGSDIGGGFGSSDGSYVTIANKDNLTKKIGEINSADNKDELLSNVNIRKAYEDAYNTLKQVDIGQNEVDNALTNLETALNSKPVEPSKPELEQPKVSVEQAINETAALMHKNTPNPNVGTLDGEWTVLSLARSGYEIPKSYYDNYYNNVVNTLKECNGILHKAKYTEYSRVILGLTSIGKDVENVGGYNLLEKLADFNKVKNQGINGPIFALIALDTNNYDIPTVEEGKVQTTRENLIDFILDKEIKKGTDEAGGWALTGNIPDPDITAMALQALAKYKDDEKVKPYIDRAINALSRIQLPTGGYDSWGSSNSESIAQVIVALTALDIDPAKDERFIKSENKWLISAIMDFYVEGGGFKHVLNQGMNGMATDQGMYALVAYDRFTKGKASLYDMTDISKEVEEENEAPIINAKDITVEAGDTIDFLKDVTATDKEDGKIEKIEVEHTVPLSEDNKTTKAGEYEATYSAIDSKGAVGTKTIKVIVKEKPVEENEAPVINAKDITVEVGDVLDFLKDVTATDKEDGKIEKIEVEHTVPLSEDNKTTKAGTYSATYSAADSKGAVGTKTIKVIVKDKPVEENEAPVINAKDITVELGDVIDFLKDVTATDKEDGKIEKIEVKHTVPLSEDNKTTKAGEYSATYSVTDSKGAVGTKTVNVIVKDKPVEENEAPVINAKDITAKVGEEIDFLKDVTAEDKEDGKIEKVEVEHTVPLSEDNKAIKAGKYEATYSATDSKGATATKTVNVTVEDNKLIEPKVPVKEAINDIASYMYNNIKPGFGTSNGEWTILSLARSGYKVDEQYYKNYYDKVCEVVEQGKGNLSGNNTEYSRLIIGLTSIGKNPQNVCGYNLLEKFADFNEVKKQGINGPIFALIALDTNNYEIPIVEGAKEQTTKDKLIDYILDKEIKKGTNEAGGWALFGNSVDPDMTSMALQALAKYKDEEKVKPYIDRAVNALSKIQMPTGGYGSWGTVNCESIAQVIVALTALDVDIAKDERFIKSGNQWMIPALMEFYDESGRFKHTLNGGANGIATDQGMYALVAYDRFVNGKNRLYDMTDVPKEAEEKNEAPVINANHIIVKVGKQIDFLEDVKVTDKEDGEIEKIEVKHTVPLSEDSKAKEAGKYEVTYSATDSKGAVGTKTVNVVVIKTEDIKIGTIDEEISKLKKEIVESLKVVEEPQITLLNDGKYLYTIRIPKEAAKSYGPRSLNAETVQDYTTIALILSEKDIKPEIKGVKDITVKTGEKIDLLKDITAKDGLEVPVEVKIQNEDKLPIENGKVTKEGKYTVIYTAKRGDVETTEKAIMEVKSESSGGGNTDPSKPEPSKPDPSKPDVKEEKLIGSTRYETAIKVSKKGWETSDNVILVNGNAISDALAVTPFAKQKGAPILLTDLYKLNEDTKAEIKRLKAKNVFIVGGDGVVSEAILSELKEMGIKVERIAGDTRYETSLAIAKEMSNVSKIVIVNGLTGLSDATSIAAVAGIENMPILLMPTGGTNIYDEFIKANNIKKSYVIGEVGVLSKAIENTLPNPERVGGANRNETNARIIEKFYNVQAIDNMFICKDGSNKESELIDALSVGALAAKENSPVVIVSNTLSNSQKEILKSKLPKAMTQIGGGCEKAFEQIKKLY